MDSKPKESQDISRTILTYIKYFLLLVAIVVIAVSCYTAYFLTRHADPSELFIFLSSANPQEELGNPIILLRNARTNQGISDKKIEVRLLSLDKKNKFKFEKAITTDKNGIAVFPLEKIIPGTYIIEARYRDNVIAQQKISFANAVKCLVSTDKPVYKPGQIVHIRVLSLNAVTGKPDSTPVNINLSIPGDISLLNQTCKPSKYGICSVDFPLAEVLRHGTYKVTAIPESKLVRNKKNATTSFEVGNYALPPFKSILSIDRPSYKTGAILNGKIKATYMFGNPVAGADIKLKATTTIRKTITVISQGWWRTRSTKQVDEELVIKELSGKTKKNGEFEFKINIPESLGEINTTLEDTVCKLTASITSPDNYTIKLNKEPVITERPVRVSAWSDQEFVPGSKTHGVYVETTDPSGAPLQTKVTINEKSKNTGPGGIIRFTGLPNKSLVISVKDKFGNIEKIPFHFRKPTNLDIILSTDKSEYRPGEEIKLEIAGSDITGQLFVAICKEDSTLSTTPVEIKNSTGGTASIKLPDNCYGTIKLKAFNIIPGGYMKFGARMIQVLPTKKILVKTTFNKPEYHPGSNAKVNFKMTDSTGSPVPGALSVSAIDKTVFTSWPQPPLNQYNYFMFSNQLHPYISGQSMERFPALLTEEYIAPGMAVSTSIKYALAEKKLVDKKNDYIKQLSKIFGWAAIIIMVIISLPYLLLGSDGKSFQHNAIIVGEEQSRMIHSSFQSIINLSYLCFFTITFSVPRNFIMGLIFNTNTPYFRETTIPTLIIVLLIIQTASWMNCRKIKPLISEAQRNSFVFKLISFFPIYYLTAGAFGLIVQYSCEIDNYGVIIPAVYLLAALSLTPLINARNLWLHICTQEYFDSRVNARLSIKSGLGIHQNSKGKMWFMVLLFSFMPIIGTYVIIGLSILSLFMPLIHIVEKLGGGGGGGGSYAGPKSISNNIFAPPKSGLYFNMAGDASGIQAMPRVRKFFPETLYWNPQIITDNKGNASISFNVADSITNYRFGVNAVTSSGMLSSDYMNLKVFQNFYADFNPPETVTSNDEISLPVTLYNYLNKPQSISIAVKAVKALKIGAAGKPVIIPPKSVKTVYVKVKFTEPGIHKLQLLASGQGTSDAIEREINVKPDGQLVTGSIGSPLMKSEKFLIKVPANALQECRKLYVKLYPAILSNITDSVAGMLRDPHGCFEQTTSAAYPNILALQFLNAVNYHDSKRKAEFISMIQKGYQRILTFETSDGGFCYFPGYKPQIRLTAYGLMLLRDMTPFLKPNDTLISCLEGWLERHQNSDGSWSQERYRKMSNLAFTSFTAVALVDPNRRGFSHAQDKAINYILKNIKDCTNPYELAICVNALIDYHKDAEALETLNRLVKMIDNNTPGWQKMSSQYGMFCSYGRTARTEALSWAILAALKTNTHKKFVFSAVEKLYRMRWRYGWGSTYTTVMALKALSRVARSNVIVATKDPFTFKVTHNNETLRETISPDSSTLTRFLLFKNGLTNGLNALVVNAVDNIDMSFSATYSYYMPWPQKPKPNPVLKIELLGGFSKQSLAAGDFTESRLCLKNSGEQPLKMGMIEQQVPPGFHIEPDSVKSLLDKKLIADYEQKKGKLILYLNELSAGRNLLLSYKLKAAYPCKITIRPAVAYPYYQPSEAVFSTPEQLTVTPQSEGDK